MRSTDLTSATAPMTASATPATWPDLRPLAIESHWLQPAGATAARRLVVAYPHPDDETFSSGGTIARYSAAGVPRDAQRADGEAVERTCQ